MNPSTKAWLLVVLDDEELRAITAYRAYNPTQVTAERARATFEMARIEAARRLVEQGPEEPAR